MTWNQTEIRVLRLKLGLSQMDFAVKLSCSKDDLVCLETGRSEPSELQNQQLEVLHRQAQANSEEIQCQSLVDILLAESDLAQIDQQQLLDRLV